MARVKISGPTAKVTDALLGGTPVPALKAWFDFAKGQRSVIATTQSGVSSIEVNSEDINMAPLELALSEGFTVEGAPVFIKMSNSKYNGNVPVGISNRSYVVGVDEDQQTIIRKWNEWKDDYHAHMDAEDGSKIVPGNSWGTELTSAELSTLLGLTGYTLMLGHEVKDYLPQPEPIL